MSDSSRGTYILIGLVAGVGVLAGALFVSLVLFCFGITWIFAPGPEIASVDVEPGVPFSLMAPKSPETARSVFLEFVVEHEHADPWAVEGWVELDGVRFEIDLKPDGEGVVGYPVEWEEDLKFEESHLWSEVSGEILLGSLPPDDAEGAEGQVDGQVWGLPGTEFASLRVYARE